MERDNAVLFIPYSLLNNHNISNYSMMVYCYLQKLTTTSGENIHYVSAYSIACYLTGKTEHPRKFLDNIKQAIIDLIEIEILNMVQEIGKSNLYFAIDCSKLWINTQEERFIIIYYDEVLKIMKLDNSNKPVILKYFIYLMGTLMTKTEVTLPSSLKKAHVVGRYTIDTIGEQFGVSEYSVLSYNKILEDAQLLYIFRYNGYAMNKVKGLFSLPNIYGRYEDKEFVDVYGKQSLSAYDLKKYGSGYLVDSNSKRSLAQRYNQLVSGGGENYTKNDILEIYDYIIKENQLWYSTYLDKPECKWMLQKIRDVDVFEIYDYIDTTEAKRQIAKVHEINDCLTNNHDIL